MLLREPVFGASTFESVFLASALFGFLGVFGSFGSAGLAGSTGLFSLGCVGLFSGSFLFLTFRLNTSSHPSGNSTGVPTSG